MQVRKFEAKTMKEALDLVKQHLGPEAIILAAKDNSRGFGLIGEKSVEVTAAVTDETLRRKKLAETKLRQTQRNQFYQAPARQQKQFIEKVVERPRVNAQPALPRPLTGVPYIDIDDEEMLQQEAAPSSSQRIRAAAHRAQTAGQSVLQNDPRRAKSASGPGGTYRRSSASPAAVAAAVTAQVPAAAGPAAGPQSTAQIHALESQIFELKSIIEKFQKMPQTLSSHPGAEEGLPFELTGAFQRLMDCGVSRALTVQILKRAEKQMDRDQLKKPAMVDAWIVQYLLNAVEIVKDPVAARYHIFMGTTGQGKTTTLVKLAAHLLMKEKKRIAIVSLDTLKVGASDQLKIYAQILNVPFAVIRRAQDWPALEERLDNVQHILVDCPGLNLRTMEEMEWLKGILPPISMNRAVHYVQSSVARDEEAFDLASRYQMIGFNDVIFTRLDESTRHGIILNFQDRFRAPLHSFGVGTRIPEDFEWATKERMTDLIFKISKINKSTKAREVEHGY